MQRASGWSLGWPDVFTLLIGIGAGALVAVGEALAGLDTGQGKHGAAAAIDWASWWDKLLAGLLAGVGRVVVTWAVERGIRSHG